MRLSPHDVGVDELARSLRVGSPAVFGRVQDGALWLDLRTVFPEQDAQIVSALHDVAANENGDPDEKVAPAESSDI